MYMYIYIYMSFPLSTRRLVESLRKFQVSRRTAHHGPPAAGKVSSFRAGQGGNPTAMFASTHGDVHLADSPGHSQKSRVHTPASDNLQGSEAQLNFQGFRE